MYDSVTQKVNHSKNKKEKVVRRCVKGYATEALSHREMRFSGILRSILFLFSKFQTNIIYLLLFISMPVFSYMDYPYGVGFQIIHLPLLPIDNVNPGKGKFSARVNVRQINVWSIQSNRFITDGEEGQLEPSLRYALTDDSQVGFSVPIAGRGGGFLDHSIEIFHRSTGVTQGQRDNYPRNRFNVSYEPLAPYYPLLDQDIISAYFIRNYDLRTYPRNTNDPPVFFPSQEDQLRKMVVNQYFPYLNEYKTEDSIGSYDAVTFANPKFYFQSTVLKGNFLYDKITMGTQAKIPVRTIELIGTSGLDLSVFAVYHKDWFNGKINWKFGISYSYFETQKFRNLDLQRNQWTFRPSLVYNLSEQWKFHFEYVYYASPILRWNRLSVPTHQIGLGVSRRFDDYNLQFALFENILTYSNTPDIGFLISLEKFNLNLL